MDRVRVEGIEFHGFHGFSPAEQEVGHRFRADLTLELPTAAAAQEDDLGQTVDYAEAARVVLQVAGGPPVRLVETLAERMAARLLERFPLIRAVEVRLAKVHPPVDVLFACAAVEIRRERD
jgi:dihydroneopterin aldolase